MHFLIRAEIPVEVGNRAVKDGSIGKTLESIMADLKPAFAFFMADEGKRTANLIVNLEDASQIPAVAEPFFLSFNADVQIDPVMLGPDLEKAMQGLEPVIKKYG